MFSANQEDRFCRVDAQISLTLQSTIYTNSNTGGNVVRGNRMVMQMKSLRDHPYMSYGTNKQWNQLCDKSCFNCFYRFGA